MNEMIVAFSPIWFVAVRLLLAGYLLWAAWGKLRHRTQFRTGLAAYHLLPIGAVAPVAAGLPLIELLLGIGLITGVGLPVVS